MENRSNQLKNQPELKQPHQGPPHEPQLNKGETNFKYKEMLDSKHYIYRPQI